MFSPNISTIRTTAVAGLIAGVVILFSACHKLQTPVVMELTVYDPANPGSVRSNGDWDGSPVNVFLDGRRIGVTPLRFTQEDLQGLGLPRYEDIKLSETESWRTWELDTRNSFEIASPESRDVKRRMYFESVADPSRPIHLSGFMTQGLGNLQKGHIKISLKMRKEVAPNAAIHGGN